MTRSQTGNEWRRVVAALANPDIRRIVGLLFLDEDTTGALAELSPSRRRHIVQTLTGSGIAIDGASGALSLNASIFSDVLMQDPARKAVGVERFLRNGKIAQYPMDRRERAELLDWVARRAFTDGDRVDEHTVNERLEQFSDDVAVLRRYLVVHGLVDRARDGSEYRYPAAPLA